MLVVERGYDVEGARKRYRFFVGNPDSQEGKLVVEYLGTVLGETTSRGRQNYNVSGIT